jgi:hypothetical protein
MALDSQRRLPLVGVSIVALLYVTSLFLPSLSIPTINERLLDRVTAEIGARTGGPATINPGSMQGPRTIELRGYDCFRESLRVGSNGLTLLIWCANPLIWLGAFWLATRRFVYARLAGVAAVGLALVALVMPHIGQQNADIYWSWHDYRIGYWCWLASAGALAVFTTLARRSQTTGFPEGSS